MSGSDGSHERVETFGNYRVALQRLDKVLYPDTGFTKSDVIEYYRGVADVLLPHVENRALTLHRFPDGIAAEGFFQKHFQDYFPAWLGRREVRTKHGTMDVVVCNNLASLLYVANQAAISLHIGLSRLDKPDLPDQFVIDLDPPDDGAFDMARRAALDCLALFDAISLPAYVKTTGSRGLHVTVPLRRKATFETVREFVRECALWLIARYPDRYTLEQRMDKRGGRLYLDIQRNAYGQTVVAPYSLRALPGAPIAAPIARDALKRNDLSARTYTLKNCRRHMEEITAPWCGMRRRACGIERPWRTLSRL